MTWKYPVAQFQGNRLWIDAVNDGENDEKHALKIIVSYDIGLV